MKALIGIVCFVAVAFCALADFQVKYPESVAKRPPLRGVMLPPEKVTEKHFRTLKEWGVTLGRYQMMPTGPDAWLTTTNCARYAAWLDAKLDTLANEVLPLANRYGIQLVIDIHVPPGGRDGQIMHMCDRREYLDCFVECWRHIAICLKGRPGVYGYDLINEPDQKREAKIADYREVQRLAAEAVRAIDPDTTILVASNGWNKPDNFAHLSPLAMDNVIYQVHVYQPMAFTHQGVLPKYKDEVTRWPDEAKGWNKDWLRKLLKPVREFQQRHHAKIYAGEFSAVSWAEGADRYLADLISLFEEYGWDWSYHAFREWPGWDAEKVCVGNARQPDKAKFKKDPDNPRLRVLRDAFAGRSGKLLSAIPVWPEGRTTERNLTVGFRVSFDGEDAAELRYSASSIARVWLNGEFLCYGPARGPHGTDRVDVIPLAGRVKSGRNVLAFEVAGYNVESFYLLNEPAYLAAEVRSRDGRILAMTKPDGPFEATVISERVQKVPRFSYQRPFCEVYRLKTDWASWRTGGARTTVPLAAVPGSPWIERTAPYPAYDVSRVFRPLRRGRLGNRTPTKLHEGRSVTGEDNPKRGYAKSEIAVQPVYEIQRLSDADYVLYDHGLCDTGFLGAKVVCRKPGRVYFYFDEVLVDGDIDVSRMDWQCVNAVTCDFEEPGEYAIEAFEPNTFRYLKVMFDGFEGEVSDLFVRGYKNDETGRAAFESSDPALNEIFAAARETFVQNAVDALTDCPSRERAGWLCDSFFSGRSERWLTGSNPVERCFLENFARTSYRPTKEDAFLPMCYPADAGLLPNWNFWFVFELEEYLARTGDRALIELMRPKVEGVIASFRKYRNADGLLEKLPGWVFIEWSEANKLVQDVNYPSNMTYAKMLEVAARLYGWTDCADEAGKVRETVRRQSWTGEWFCDNAVRQKDGSLKLSGECTETCQYYAFYFGTADAKDYPELWNRLVSDFGPKRRETKAWPKIHPANAFIGNYLRLELLSRAGLSVQILDETKGYLHGMARRTGTLWEHDNISNSCDHGFASHAAVVLFRDVLGVRSVDPIARRIVIKVDQNLPLSSCRGTVPLSATEELRVEWRKSSAGVDVWHVAPEGWMIVEEPQDVYNERPVLATPGKLSWRMTRHARQADGKLVVDVPAGEIDGGADCALDLKPFADSGIAAEIDVTGTDVSKPFHGYNGVKFQISYTDAKTGRRIYRDATERPRGTFGKTKLHIQFAFDGQVPENALLRLGLQESSGRVIFDLATLRMGENKGLFRKVNADYKVQYPADVASRRRRGVMSPSRDMTEDDFRTLKDWGANLIRYQMVRSWSKYDDNQDLEEYDRWQDGRLDHLDRVVLPLAEKYGIDVVIDLHVFPGGRSEAKESNVLHDRRFADHLVERWRKIATRFRGRRNVYGYDIVNELNQRRRSDVTDYWNLQREAAEAIRAIDPVTPIIVGANLMENPSAFTYLSPLRMDNVIYQVHMYEPGPFTHYRVHPEEQKSKPDPTNAYPSDRPDGGRWDKDFLRSVLESVRRFQLQHDARIYVGEFSAAAWTKGADRYLADCISLFEEYGWDWSYHAFREWPGWSVEHEGPDKDHLVPSADNPRKRALLNGLRLNRTGESGK